MNIGSGLQKFLGSSQKCKVCLTLLVFLFCTALYISIRGNITPGWLKRVVLKIEVTIERQNQTKIQAPSKPNSDLGFER